MLTDWELWACANDYVVRHAEDGPVIAARRCGELLDARDNTGARNYQKNILRINRLLEVATSTVR